MTLFTNGFEFLVSKYGYIVFRGTEKECRNYMKEHENDVEEDEE